MFCQPFFFLFQWKASISWNLMMREETFPDEMRNQSVTLPKSLIVELVGLNVHIQWEIIGVTDRRDWGALLYSPARERLTQRKADGRKLFKYLKDRPLKEEFQVVSPNQWMATAGRKISVQVKEFSYILNYLKGKETVLVYSSLSVKTLKNNLDTQWLGKLRWMITLVALEP